MAKKFKKNRPRAVITLIAVISVSALTLIIKKHEKQPPPVTKPLVKTLAAPPAQKEEPYIRLWRRVTVQSGDNLHNIFANLQIPQEDFWHLINTKGANIDALQPKQNLEFTLDKDHQLLEIRLPLPEGRVKKFTRKGDAFQKEIVNLPTKIVTLFKTGEINSSFGVAANKAGVPRSISQTMAKIFEGEVDFSRDLRAGDTFSVLYSEKLVAGRKPKPENIIAAELTTSGKVHKVVYFKYPKDHSGYYTLEGKGVTSRFLKFPVKFTRISSHFNRHRLDPVVHRVQAHSGVDLAAPQGTPIHSIGNGRIVFIGKSHGYGNTIKIRYDKHYTGLYAHMRNFASHLKMHQRVKKGQVIGYVGQTGWATGPHLHFGIYVNGVAQDWLKLKPPTTGDIPRSYKTAFNQYAKKAIAQLENHEQIMLALKKTGELQ